MNLEGKKISIIGAERSGTAAAKLIKKLGGFPFVSDSGKVDKLASSIKLLKQEKIDYEIGKHSDKVFDADFIVTSPGVPSDAKVILSAKAKGLKVISEVELASYYCKGKIIAITGTNGKTTTTALINHLLNTVGYKSYAAGNIGIAFSDVVLEVKENEFVSLEVSSFQLDHIESFKPAVSIILNITPDHLNRYDNNFDKYAASKMQIFTKQSNKDYLIVNYDDPSLHNINKVKPKLLHFSLKSELDNGAYLSGDNIIVKIAGKKVFECNISNISLRGEHNYMNVMASLLAVIPFIKDESKLPEGLSSFKGVEHRLELVREIDGVKYINDSKATNIDSVWFALRSFNERIFLILGGQDKGNDYSSIKDLVLSKVDKIYAIGSSADKIFNFFHKELKVEIKKSLEDAVLTANQEARAGQVVLLSPACASFDMFDNYEHRGRVFKEAVNSL